MRCNDGVDRISQLPDEIIVHVLSFLPLKDAAATSVLSLRWIHLWKQVPNLKFEDSRLYSELCSIYQRVKEPSTQQIEKSKLCMRKYIDRVNSVLALYKSQSLQEFSILALVDRSNQHEFTKWLEFAFSRRVHTLKLISDKVWVNAGVLLKMLKDMSIPSSDYFKSLKVLWLKSFYMRSEAIEFFLGCCPMLESLVLEILLLTTKLEVNSGSLKHLDMRCSRWAGTSVKIRAPNLTCLVINQDMNKVSFENVPKLVNMTLFYHKTTDTMLDFVEVARQLETLIIMLTKPDASLSIPEMPNLKKLVVYYKSQKENNGLLPVTRFMRASPALEDFRIEVGGLDVQREIFEIPEDGPRVHEHRHLRRFVLSGFCGGACDRIELVRYVVNQCGALEEIVIGQCNREGLVRGFVDYCVPPYDIIPRRGYPNEDYVATPQERQDINKVVRLFTPPRIKLRVV